MQLKVLFSEDPAFVLSRAGVFLSSQPVLHNLILSTLHARVAQGDPGRYWMAIQGDDIVRRCHTVATNISSYADTDGTAGGNRHGRCDC